MLSRHAQARASAQSISDQMVEAALLQGTIVPDGFEVVRIEHQGIVLVILERPTPFRGSKLIKTIFRRMPDR